METIQAQAELPAVAISESEAIASVESQTLAMMGGATEHQETVAPVAPAPAEPAAPAVVPVEPVAPEEPIAPAVLPNPVIPPEGVKPPEEPGDEPHLTKRMRPQGTDRDKAITIAANILVGTEGIPIEEAIARVSGKTLSAPVQAQVEPAIVIPAEPTDLATLETQLADVDRQLEEAGASEGLFTPEIAALTKQQSRLTAKIEGAQVRAEIQAGKQAEQAQTATAVKAQQTALFNADKTFYPDMANPKSFIYLTVDRLTREVAQDPNSPHYKKLFEPDAPQYFNDLAAQEIGIQVANRTGTKSPVIPVTPAAPRTQVVPAPGSKGTAPLPPAPTLKDAANAVNAGLVDMIQGKGFASTEQALSKVVIG